MIVIVFWKWTTENSFVYWRVNLAGICNDSFLGKALFIGGLIWLVYDCDSFLQMDYWV